MTEQDVLADRFEADRDHLTAVAFRVLGSRAEADDAVQEAWLRLSRTDVSEVANLTGWLTTVVSRVCLDMLRQRGSRRESELDDQRLDSGIDRGLDQPAPGPEAEAMLADAVGPALLVVLDALTPAERLAFVLHDLFGVPFDEIASIIGKTPAAARQLASRARRRVRGGGRLVDPDRVRRRQVVDAFLAASRDGDFAALIQVLDPDIVVRADPVAAEMGAERELRGADLVAATYNGRSKALRSVLIDGEPGAVWQHRGEVMVMFVFGLTDGRIASIELVADPQRLAAAEISFE